MGLGAFHNPLQLICGSQSVETVDSGVSPSRLNEVKLIVLSLVLGYVLFQVVQGVKQTVAKLLGFGRTPVTMFLSKALGTRA